MTTAEVIATQWRLHRYYGTGVVRSAYYVSKFSVWLGWKALVRAVNGSAPDSADASP